MFTYDDRSLYEKIIHSFSEQQLDVDGSSLMDMSHKESEKLDGKGPGACEWAEGALP